MAEHPHAALIRKGYEAFSRGDMETLRGIITGDATHHLPGNNPMSGDYKGIDSILDLYRRLGEETDGTFRSELQQLLVDGRGHVMSLHRITARRAAKTFDQMGGIVFRIVGDRVTDLDECVADIAAVDDFWS